MFQILTDDPFKELQISHKKLRVETKKAIDVLSYIQEIDNNYLNAWVANAEISFSKLKLIKCFLPSTMS